MLIQKQYMTEKVTDCCQGLQNMTSVTYVMLMRQVGFFSLQTSRSLTFCGNPTIMEQFERAGYSAPCM